MSDAKARGVVHLIEETKTYGQKGFRKRLVVLEQDNDRFTNYIPFDFIQDACDSVDDLNVGDEAEITYRLSGRKWQKDTNSEVKFFLNAEATAFKVLGGTASGAAGASGIHERTLRLRLAAGGKSLQQVANRTRFELAQQVLGNTDLSVAQIAEALHYEDPDAFFQSYRAWAGNSPRQLRQA